MNTLSIPPLIMAAITFFAGAYHVLIYLRHKERRENLTFALSCLTMGSYDLFCAGLYNATSAAEGVNWQRAQVATLALASIAFPWFVYDYLKSVPAVPAKARTVLICFSVYFVLAAVTGSLDRSGLYRPLDRPAIKEVQVFGSQITYYEMDPGPLTELQSVAGLAVFAYLLFITAQAYRRGHRKETRPLLVAMGLFFASGVNDTAVSFSLYPFIYTLEYAYLGMVLVMTYSITSAVAEAAAMKHALQSSEAHLRESEERFRRLAENAPDIIFRWSTELGLEYISPIAVAVTGYSAQELLANPMLSLEIATGNDPRVIVDYQQAIAQGAAIPIREFVYTRQDGTQAWMEVRSAAIKDELGRAIAFEGILRDITERKQTEAAMRQANLIIESSPAMLFRWRAVEGWPVELVSQNVIQLGYTAEEFLSGSVLYASIMHPDDRQRISRELQTHADQGEDRFQQEYRLIARDGGVHWIEGRAIAERDAQGRVAYYQGVLIDITGRRQAEHALRESDEGFRSIFENAVMGFYRSTRDGRWLMANPALLRMLGYSSFEELAGHSIVDEAEAAAYPRSAFIERLEQEGHVAGFEAVWRKAGGGKLFIRESAKAIRDQAGNTLYYQGTVEDISLSKEVEAERERLLADLMHRETQLLTAAEVSMWASTILDPEELINQAVHLIQEGFNAYYVGLFLVDESGERARLHAGTGEAGQKMLAAGHSLDVGGRSMIGQCIGHGRARIALDVGAEAVRFNNPLLPETRSEIALPLNNRGKTIGALTVQSSQEAAFSSNDITALQAMADQLAIAIANAGLYDEVQRYATRLEERVAERTAALAAVNKELEAFAYSVSHDLRAPLRSMDGFSQALLEDYAGQLDATGQDYLHRVRAASQRMGRLIDDMLKLSRLTRVELQRERVALSDMAQEIAAELQQTAPERRTGFTIAEGVVAIGDGRLLRIVLENLMGNAWKFTSKQAEATIEFGVTEGERGLAYFVRDNGAGFDMDYADRLFGAFQRLHSGSEFEGTGIGLATVQRIIHRHGGHAWAEGAVNQGATFYFTLAAEGEEEA